MSAMVRISVYISTEGCSAQVLYSAGKVNTIVSIPMPKNYNPFSRLYVQKSYETLYDYLTYKMWVIKVSPT